MQIPSEIRAELGQRLARTRRLVPKAAWVPAQNLHVTMRFLGEIDDRLAGSLRQHLESELASTEAFGIDLGGGGFFGPESRPRVLWIGLGSRQGMASINRLFGSITRAVEASGLVIDARPFRPHLTIARPKGRWLSPDIARVIESMPAPGTHTLWVDRVDLMRSVLRPAGAVYTAQASIHLTKSS